MHRSVAAVVLASREEASIEKLSLLGRGELWMCGCVDASSKQIKVIRCHAYPQHGLLLAATTIVEGARERRQLRATA